MILIWNTRDNNNELVIENYEVNRKYCPTFRGFSDGMYGKTNDAQYNNYVNELKEIYKKHSNNGQLIMQNLTRSYIGNL